MKQKKRSPNRPSPSNLKNLANAQTARWAVQYGHKVLGLKRLLAITATDNDSATKLLYTVGMELKACTQLPGENKDTLVFAWSGPR